MTGDHNQIDGDARAAMQRYSDDELLAFWASTVETQGEDATVEAREVQLIEAAAHEMMLRGLLPPAS